MSVNRWVMTIFLILSISSIAYINYLFQYPDLIKVLYSVITLLIAYIANIFTENLIKRQIHETRERYTIRKAVSTIISILFFGAILAIWFQETTTLVLAFGLLSAGIAIALQDVLKNLTGGIIIILTSPFKAGDRIQVENDAGDVLDIKLFSTTLMEIREWVEADQYSGRLLLIPNSFILNKTVKNYSKDFSFIWDEIHFMLTYDSNWKKAQEIAIKTTHEITNAFEISAKNELRNMEEKYLIHPSDVDENIYTKITDNWIDMRLRYVVDPRQRRKVSNSLYEKILEAFNQEKDIKIASATFEIVGFPPVRIEK
ncbi:MAG: mechanosensitive channel MscS [Candidatus Methanoperedens nitroreducens]|uniref:Mechanosensitive channel MscS n=1 Tax=Candidatus Methanoperedens nitratireducens TaxID=1392998 RepID=A0A0P8AFJ6_9EURY|nr:mechanosensitive ion channel domain-containing protein [Candidatus Methanoperedens sp. BLZ2]KAB2948011.1 MAG: mechanosensitive ion channel [Candidatus Methanoperedens sp.]KPQ43070.1 MAG: mechanosensitive channel MscS [Candidatus Methanoperedens sp. BLZ1]MBZ0176350.1 mechanosensitive ion channel family protein [Candidatus Methanoperedens nitroreducens]MCX9080191.1 mechanosensitive ion channel [Candidatus Methanoperedens sp.]